MGSKRPAAGRTTEAAVTVALVERARNGDEAAFAELVDLHGDRCYAIAYRILRDMERAQDAVQQAFLLCWRELPKLRDPERFGVWLHRLLVNACYEEYRRHKRWTTNIRALPLEGPEGPDSIASVADRGCRWPPSPRSSASRLAP
jgi:DNA-directed RNA polymerase specialized sigma24 family protein